MARSLNFLLIYSTSNQYRAGHEKFDTIGDPIEFFASSPEQPFESRSLVGTFESINFLISPSMVLEYRKIEENKLPSPYQTQCFDYTQVGLTSQDQCINHCVRNYSLFTGAPIRNLLDTRVQVNFQWPRGNELDECLKINKRKEKGEEIFEENGEILDLYHGFVIDLPNSTAECLTMVRYFYCQDVMCSKTDCERSLYALWSDSSLRDGQSQVILKMPSERDVFINNEVSFDLVNYL